MTKHGLSKSGFVVSCVQSYLTLKKTKGDMRRVKKNPLNNESVNNSTLGGNIHHFLNALVSMDVGNTHYQQSLPVSQ